MNPTAIDPEALRRVMTQIPEPLSTRIVALAVSAAFLAIVFDLVRKGRLKEEYTPIWTIVALGVMALSLWLWPLRLLTQLIGAWAPSSTLFFLGELFLMVLCLNYAVRLSHLSTQVKLLAQELALLKAGEEREGP